MKRLGIRNIILCILVLLSVPFSCTAVYSTIYAQTIVSEVPVYDENLNCYVQITTETYTEYNSQLACNVVKKRTITTYYTYNDNNYVLLNQTFSDEIVSYEPVETIEPTGVPQIVPTAHPLQTPQPSGMPIQSPTAAPTPTREPIMLTAPEIEVNRKSDSKAKISWEPVENADGYIVYRSKKEFSGYTKVKKVTNGLKISCTDNNLNASSTYYYKVKAYQNNGEEEIRYTKMSDPEQLVTVPVKKLEVKLEKLKKMYPDGMYWNHVKQKVSSGQSTYGFVTRYPCVHNGRMVVGGKVLTNMSSTCNYYKYKVDGRLVMGYQCAGFAAMLNDRLFGVGNFKSFRSYSKAKVGDCVRYNNHSVVIISKHPGYIRVAECNYGSECRIKWGRRIKKSELTGAVFYSK